MLLLNLLFPIYILLLDTTYCINAEGYLSWTLRLASVDS